MNKHQRCNALITVISAGWQRRQRRGLGTPVTLAATANVNADQSLMKVTQEELQVFT
jgi:hypothetical protein